jgi:release factor glutamine methyltransferase
MTTGEALQTGTERLRESGSVSPELDAEILLAFALKMERTALFRNPERVLPAKAQAQFAGLLNRRVRREPIAYLVGHKEFYDHDFFVDRNVLIPRPESEMNVETFLEMFQRSAELTIADIGTGSGCLAVTLALFYPNAKIIATDISEQALNVARKNAERFNVQNRITFLIGNLLEPLTEHNKLDAVIANLPYVPDEERRANPDLAYEPVLALSGIKEPEQLYAEFFEQWKARPDHPVALLEIHPAMRDFLEHETECLGISATFKQDLAGKDRVMIVGTL